MRFKKTTWLNTKTNKPVYGISVKRKFDKSFMNLAENGKPLFFNSAEKRDAKIANIKEREKTLTFEMIY